jgi:hypothetical protein
VNENGLDFTQSRAKFQLSRNLAESNFHLSDHEISFTEMEALYPGAYEALLAYLSQKHYPSQIFIGGGNGNTGNFGLDLRINRSAGEWDCNFLFAVSKDGDLLIVPRVGQSALQVLKWTGTDFTTAVLPNNKECYVSAVFSQELRSLFESFESRDDFSEIDLTFSEVDAIFPGALESCHQALTEINNLIAEAFLVTLPSIKQTIILYTVLTL